MAKAASAAAVIMASVMAAAQPQASAKAGEMRSGESQPENQWRRQHRRIINLGGNNGGAGELAAAFNDIEKLACSMSIYSARLQAMQYGAKLAESENIGGLENALAAGSK
jgi:hypothetical protein